MCIKRVLRANPCFYSQGFFVFGSASYTYDILKHFRQTSLRSLYSFLNASIGPLERRWVFERNLQFLSACPPILSNNCAMNDHRNNSWYLDAVALASCRNGEIKGVSRAMANVLQHAEWLFTQLLLGRCTR
jgi:hypothetical protein